MLHRRCVMLVQPCFNVGHWRCINVVRRGKTDLGFCFIFNVVSTLFEQLSKMLTQRSSTFNVGWVVSMRKLILRNILPPTLIPIRFFLFWMNIIKKKPYEPVTVQLEHFTIFETPLNTHQRTIAVARYSHDRAFH